MRKVLSFVIVSSACAFCVAQSAVVRSADISLASGQGSERVRLSEILILTPRPYEPSQLFEAERKAEVVRNSIGPGTSFIDAAKANSQGPTAAVGGDLGCFSKGKLAHSIEDLVFGMKVGDVSDVVRTKQGFIILQVTSRGEEACADLGELTPYVEAVKEKVRRNWYHLAPNTARLPERKQGSVTVEFSILRNGGIANDRVIVNSGEADLDAAALSAVREANPFAQLPNTFRADHLQLRFHFLYNPSDTVIKAN